MFGINLWSGRLVFVPKSKLSLSILEIIELKLWIIYLSWIKSSSFFCSNCSWVSNCLSGRREAYGLPCIKAVRSWTAFFRTYQSKFTIKFKSSLVTVIRIFIITVLVLSTSRPAVRLRTRCCKLSGIACLEQSLCQSWRHLLRTNEWTSWRCSKIGSSSWSLRSRFLSSNSSPLSS